MSRIVIKKLPEAVQNIGKRIHTKHLFFFGLILFLLTLVPLFLVAPCNYPCYDDFVFGLSTKQVFEETGSVWNTLVQAWTVAKINYEVWQGTFVAIFLFALQPATFGLQYYALVPLIMVAALTAGMVFFSWVVTRRLLHATRWTAGLLALLLTFTCIHLVPVPNRSFYWYNGSVYYTFFQGLFFLMAGFLLIFCLPGKRARRYTALGVSSILAFLIGGSNYVTGAFAGVLLVFLIVVLLSKKKRGWLGLFFPLVLLAVCLLFSVAAPGNAFRQAQMPEQLGFVRSIIHSVVYVFIFTAEWFTPGFIFLMLLLAPFLWRLADGVEYSFRFPWLVTLMSVGYLAIGMFPHIYAVSIPGPPRLTNIIFFMFVFLFAGNMLYWFGWLQSKAKNYHDVNGITAGQGIVKFCKTWSLPAILLFLLGGVGLVIAPARLAQPFTFDLAFATWRHDLTQGYKEEMDARIAQMKLFPGSDLVFEGLQNKPELLLYFEIGEDPCLDVNVAMANYFGVKSLRVEAEENS